MKLLRGQGATEYLVLLAVVLIVALVSVALLGFFPGMASDAQITQSKMYWSSAQPISIIEWDARGRTIDSTSYPYLRIRNVGAYPIRITGIVGGDGVAITTFYTYAGTGCDPNANGAFNISDYYYMAPGEEKYFAYMPGFGGIPCSRSIYSIQGGSGGHNVGGAASVCQNSTSAPGALMYNSFGFNYIQYMDNQQITKRQIGTKPLIIKCKEPYPY